MSASTVHFMNRDVQTLLDIGEQALACNGGFSLLYQKRRFAPPKERKTVGGPASASIHGLWGIMEEIGAARTTGTTVR